MGTCVLTTFVRMHKTVLATVVHVGAHGRITPDGRKFVEKCIDAIEERGTTRRLYLEVSI